MASIETSAALQRVAARFAERLPARLDGIDRLIALWCSDSSPSQLDEIIRTCHDLAGTAPTVNGGQIPGHCGGVKAGHCDAGLTI